MMKPTSSASARSCAATHTRKAETTVRIPKRAKPAFTSSVISDADRFAKLLMPKAYSACTNQAR